LLLKLKKTITALAKRQVIANSQKEQAAQSVNSKNVPSDADDVKKLLAQSKVTYGGKS